MCYNISTEREQDKGYENHSKQRKGSLKNGDVVALPTYNTYAIFDKKRKRR